MDGVNLGKPFRQTVHSSKYNEKHDEMDKLKEGNFKFLKEVNSISVKDTTVEITSNSGTVSVNKDKFVNVLNKSLKNGLSSGKLTKEDVANTFKRLKEADTELSDALMKKNTSKKERNNKKDFFRGVGGFLTGAHLGIDTAIAMAAGAATAATAATAGIAGGVIAGVGIVNSIYHSMKAGNYGDLEDIYKSADMTTQPGKTATQGILDLVQRENGGKRLNIGHLTKVIEKKFSPEQQEKLQAIVSTSGPHNYRTGGVYVALSSGPINVVYSREEFKGEKYREGVLNDQELVIEDLDANAREAIAVVDQFNNGSLSDAHRIAYLGKPGL